MKMPAMNSPLPLAQRLRKPAAIAIAAGAAIVTPLTASVSLDLAHQAYAAETHVLAEAPSFYDSSITDTAGILSSSQISEIESAIREAEQVHRTKLYVVFVDSFDGQSSDVWSSQALDANGGSTSNVGVYAVAVEDRAFAVQLGDQWPVGALDDMYNAAYDRLRSGSEPDWAGSALALAEAASQPSFSGGGTTSGGPSTSADGESAAWLGAGAGAVALAGGGIWAYSRRKKKADTQASLESARAIEPTNTSDLMNQPMEVLERLAEEELVSTDEAIRNSREELDIATAEFGAERTRSFTRAMNNSTTTLQKAFALKQRLNSGAVRDEYEKRALLVEIISSCGVADDALESEAQNFADMRSLLMNAGPALDNVTQSTIDLRARIPEAEAQLEHLKTQYSSAMLSTITDNVPMAKVSLEEAERNLELGRTIASKPAGQQGGLVDAIHQAEEAATNADKLLKGIENAQSDITAAKAGLPGLIKEIEDEIEEATQLRSQGLAQGTQADWQALDAVVAKAKAQLTEVHSAVQTNPLGAWHLLTEVDSKLDEQLDTVRTTTADHNRQLQIFDKQMATAQAAITAAEDFIKTRGRLVKSDARTHLANAQRLFAETHQGRNSQTRQATELARQAARAAKLASQQAQRDVDDYNRRQQRQSSSNAGGIITGMVINEILNGSSRGGGFGGGFGGGGFSGGGGGFRGGRF